MNVNDKKVIIIPPVIFSFIKDKYGKNPIDVLLKSENFILVGPKQS